MAWTESEANRRVREACDIIRSAYRLESLNPQDTINAVKVAIVQGAEQQAEDIADDVRKAS